MGAPDLLHALQGQGLRVWAKGDRLLVAPKERITDETRALIRAHKAELLAALSDPLPDAAAEARRQRVLAILAEKPGDQRAYLTDMEADPDAVILVLAIRGLGTCELRIPRDKWDGVLFLELLERHGGTIH